MAGVTCEQWVTAYVIFLILAIPTYAVIIVWYFRSATRVRGRHRPDHPDREQTQRL